MFMVPFIQREIKRLISKLSVCGVYCLRLGADHLIDHMNLLISCLCHVLDPRSHLITAQTRFCGITSSSPNDGTDEINMSVL